MWAQSFSGLQCLMHVGPIFRWSTVLDARRPNLSMVYIQCLMVVINIVFTIIMVIVIRGSGRQCPFYKLYHYISSLLNVTLLSKMGHTDTVCDFSDICIMVESAAFSLKCCKNDQNRFSGLVIITV